MPSLGSTGGSGAFRFAGYRFGQLDGRNNTFRYPSAWWDVAHMELPRTVKTLFKWCRYHVLLNPLVSAAVKKAAAYPITDVIIDDEPLEGFGKEKERWEDFLFRVLNVKRFQIEVGLNYNAYGNAIVSLFYPFRKHLGCQSCGHTTYIKRLKFRKDWDFRNFRYQLTCPRCKNVGYARVKDVFIRSYRGIKLINWAPEDIDIDFNPITQTSEYAYNIPRNVRGKVLRKNRKYLEELPHAFVEAMRFNRPVILNSGNIFHFKTPTPSVSDNDAGWGYPTILPALKDSFYLQVMKKAQEAIMLEHLVPLDVIFPASSDQAANPYTSINLSDWRKNVEAEIVKWRWDPNHKPIMPVPLGHQRIGGDGRAMMLTQEIRTWSEHIVAGMGYPQEFIFGGLSWSGSSVSLRMLENQFLTYREMHEHFLKHFLIPSVARFMGWQQVSVHMKQFKMADDMQSKQLLMSLNQLKKVSDKSLLAEFDKDALDELKTIEQELRRNLEVKKLEQLYLAQVQGESQQVMTKYQLKAQEMQMAKQQEMQQGAMQQMGQQQQAAAAQQQAAADPKGASGVNVIDLAEAWARRLSSLEHHKATASLERVRQTNPQLADLIQQKMSVSQAMNEKPLPEQRPPRREQSPI